MNDSGQPSIPTQLTSALLADDPEMFDLVEEFLDGLSGRAAELQQAYGRLDWDRLTALAHQLKGAGGSYGYPDLSTLGAAMETSFRNHAAEQFTTWMQRFEQLTAAARAGLETGRPS